MCGVCDRIRMCEQGTNPYLVREMKTGYAVIGDHQRFYGYCLLLCKKHESELHKLPQDFRMQFLKDMSMLAEAAYNAFQPDKLNYEMLGNGIAHMHWHIFPRRDGDMPKPGPVWWLPYEEMSGEACKPDAETLEAMKAKLGAELDKVIARDEQ